MLIWLPENYSKPRPGHSSNTIAISLQCGPKTTKKYLAFAIRSRPASYHSPCGRIRQQTVYTLVHDRCTVIDFILYFCNAVFLRCKTTKLSQGSAATHWRYGGKYYMDFVGNLVLFPAVKEFWKSVKYWQSYRHEFAVLLFGDTVHIKQYSN